MSDEPQAEKPNTEHALLELILPKPEITPELREQIRAVVREELASIHGTTPTARAQK